MTRPAPLGRGAAARAALARLVHAERPILLLDLDGTLAPLGERPDAARVPAATRRTLGRLRATGVTIVVVSGRSARAVARIVATPVDGILGDHGGRALFGGRLRAWLPVDRPRLARAARAVAALLHGRERIWLERKDRSLAIHLRLPGGHAHGLARDAERVLADAGLRVLRGRRVLDAQLPGVNKGAAVRRLLAGRGHDVVLYAGDDTTDRDAFAALPRGGIGIAVGRRVPGTRLRTASPATLAAWLARLADARGARMAR